MPKGSPSTTGSTYNATGHPGMSKFGFEQAGLNLNYLATKAGKTCTKSSIGTTYGYYGSGEQYYSNCPYIQDILISVAVAALIIYIMLALLSYIPTLASNLTADLISQDIISAGGGQVKSAVFGESQAMGALKFGEKAALNASGVNSTAQAGAGMLAGDR